MKNMKVAVKLVTGFLIVTLLAVAIGAVGIFSLTSSAENTALLAERTEIAIIAARMNRNVQAQRAAFRGAAVYHVMEQADKRDSNLADLDSLEADYDALHDEVAAMLITETGKQLMAGINASYTPFMDARETFVTNIIDPAITNEVMIGQLDAVAATVAPLAESIAALVDFADTLTTQMAEEAAVTAASTTIILVAILVAAVVISTFLAIYISRLISKPLSVLTAFMQKASATGDIALSAEDHAIIDKYGKAKDETGRTIAATAAFIMRITEVSQALGTVADGDLTVVLAPLSDKDVLGISLRKMTGNLNTMFEEINTASSQVSVGSHQVADGAQALAAGSTEQAASVQELSSSISEVAERTKDNSAKAEQAAKLAVSIKGSAEKGSAQMDDMIESVKNINEASQSISKVIKTIDDIAFQTNILALNAAVEAARAGQHGKGFAVVAEEVRNLSAKSAQAAKDTENMIADSMQKAEHGVKVAGETATSLSEIVSGINESNTLISEIAQASEEQAMSISQINVGIDQVAKVVQQNSATAEESAAASEEMSSQAVVLQELISQFKLENPNPQRRVGGQTAAPPRLAPAEEYTDVPSGVYGKY